MRPLLVALLALLVLSGEASAEVRYVDRERSDTLRLPAIDCGAAHSEVAWLGAGVRAVTVVEPTVGQQLNNGINFNGIQDHQSTLTAVDTVEDPVRGTGIRFTAVGAGIACDPNARDGLYQQLPMLRGSALDYRVRFQQALPPRQITRCAGAPWRGRSVRPSRNGWASCERAHALMRGWARRSAGRPAPLVSARLQGFRCVQHAGEIACARGQARVSWRARRPKPPAKPIPGPLGMDEARSAAVRIASDFPVQVDVRETSDCRRVSEWEVHCLVTGWKTDYDSSTGEDVRAGGCVATAHVTKRPGQVARARAASVPDCF